MNAQGARYLVLFVLVAATYFGAAELGLSQAFIHANVSPVWPPTGVAIAAVIFLGYRISPAILLGAFFANLETGASALTAAAIAAGNTLEAVTALFLLEQFVGPRNPFHRARDAVKFVIIAAALATSVSATVGVTALCAGGSAGWSNFGPLWLTWWLGDAGGALIIAPLFITWFDKEAQPFSLGRSLELTLMLTSLAGVAITIFRGIVLSRQGTVSLWRLVFPLLLWAAFRLGSRGVTASMLLFSSIAIWGTRQGFGPFVGGSGNESLLLIQTFVAPLAITFLVLAAVVFERERAKQERDRLLALERDARTEAETANRLKDEFLATISHELRAPLNSILGWARLARSRDLNDGDRSRALEIIDRNAKAESRIIDDLLDVSSIVSGKLSLNVEPTRISAVIQEVIDELTPTARAKGVQLDSEKDPDSAWVMADTRRLQQILLNLVSNAIKFTPAGGRVDVRLERVGSSAQVTIADTGVGINPEFLPHVFDRFRQADSSRIRKQGGLGLGLAIVQHLVQLHGGSIVAASDGEGKGASFTLKLPLGEPVGDVERETPVDSNPNLGGLRILVVDDDADSREFIGFLFESRGAQVARAASAAQAYEMFASENSGAGFDVLVSDIGMPDEDGYQMLSRVRALEKSKGGYVPAIALTGYVGEEERARAAAAGYQSHLSKPFEPTDLLEAVRRLAGQTRRAQ